MDRREGNPLDRYVRNELSGSDFDSFRNTIDRTDDSEIWSYMNDSNTPSMSGHISEEDKCRILARLRRAIYWRRFGFCMRVASGIAALVAIVVVTVNHIPRIPDMQPVTLSVKAGSKGEITLSDGTICHLNSASTIISDMSSATGRTISLKGEAFFDVAKDTDRPLTVKVGELSITVTGTSFNVCAYDPDIIETSLVSGSVTISSPALAKEYELIPDERAVVNLCDKSVVISKFDSDVSIGWLSENLVFYSESLGDVIKKIERWYGVEIDLRRSELESDLLSGSYRRESINNVMESLSRQYGFEFEIAQDKIIIY